MNNWGIESNAVWQERSCVKSKSGSGCKVKAEVTYLAVLAGPLVRERIRIQTAHLVYKFPELHVTPPGG